MNRRDMIAASLAAGGALIAAPRPASGASTAAADLPSVLFEPQTVCLLSRRADLSRTLLATLQSAFTTLPAESDGGGIATLKDWMKQLYVVLEHAHPPVAQRNARRLDHSAHQEDAVAIAASAMDNEREEPLSPLHDGVAPAADGDDSDEADDADAIAFLDRNVGSWPPWAPLFPYLSVGDRYRSVWDALFVGRQRSWFSLSGRRRPRPCERAGGRGVRAVRAQS